MNKFYSAISYTNGQYFLVFSEEKEYPEESEDPEETEDSEEQDYSEEQEEQEEKEHVLNKNRSNEGISPKIALAK